MQIRDLRRRADAGLHDMEMRRAKATSMGVDLKTLNAIEDLKALQKAIETLLRNKSFTTTSSLIRPFEQKVIKLANAVDITVTSIEYE